jgi:hypothetical protein
MRLSSYLKKTNYPRWCELARRRYDSFLSSNPTLKWMRYVYGDVDSESKEIVEYKGTIKRGVRYTVFSLSASIIAYATAMIYHFAF